MTRKVLAPLFVAAACLFWAPPASAQCGNSLPFAHLLGSYIENCADSRPVDAVIAALGSSGTTGIANVVCESADEVGQGGGCQPAAGVLGDGKITLSGNYANPGAAGTCPLPLRNTFAIRDNNGGGLIITVGYDQARGLYVLENAHRADPASPTFDPLPLSCTPKSTAADGRSNGGQTLSLDSLAPGPPQTANVTLRNPVVFSDCDPESVGIQRNTGSCDPGTEAGAPGFSSSGNIYLTTGPCGGIAPGRSVCNGGAKADLPCSTNTDCGAPNTCVTHWNTAATLDPATLPASASIPLPVSACKGGNNPDLPCTSAAQCGSRCVGGARNNFTCTASTVANCGGACSQDPTVGCTTLGSTAQCALPAPGGTCQGRCSNAPTTACTATANCVSPGTCTISPFTCTAGTCSPLATAFTNQCVFLGSTFSFTDAFATVTESTSIMSTPIAVGGGGPGAPSARAFDVRATASAGNVQIHFRTSAELQLAGFNVLTEVNPRRGLFKVNTSMIAPQGVGGGGFTYDLAISRSSFRGGRKVIIESLLTDGTRLRSDAAKF